MLFENDLFIYYVHLQNNYTSVKSMNGLLSYLKNNQITNCDAKMICTQCITMLNVNHYYGKINKRKKLFFFLQVLN